MKEKKTLGDVRVLYVEDEDIVRLGVVNYLKRRCKEVLEASNGQEGLDLYNAEKPDLIVTDIEMPIMNGITMIDKILELDEKQPVIIVTGYDDDEHKSDKVCRNLIKPINLAELQASMVFCLEKNQK